jgi:signal transduction histidine kinase
MLSLRLRLTLAYASFFAAALCVVAVLGTRLEFEALTHEQLDATETTVRIAEMIVESHRTGRPGVLETAIAKDGRLTGVVVRRTAPDGSPAAPLPAGPRGFESFSVKALLGLRPHAVRIGNETYLISPDLEGLRPAINACAITLAVSLVLALAIAWSAAWWLTGLAIRPLLTVTAELRRFSNGDFTPRLVRTKDRAELGALIAAYNGATARVAAAFEERRDLERHMRRFVADAGHELRTPLTVIDGFLQIMRKAPPGDAAVRERALATLQAQCSRMRVLVERLMVLARLERPAPYHAEPVDVAAIAADAIAAVTAARGGRVTLDAGDVPPVNADRADIHEAIGNLVENAVKYGGGTDVLVTVAADDAGVVLRVRDRGPGIPAPERGRVFERFFRGEGRGDVEGSGLGLAIVERAVARCGGSVVLERAAPGETTFALHLPAARAVRRKTVALEV